VANVKRIDQQIGVEIIESFNAVKSDLEKISLASWFLNLLDEKTLENHADQRIFELTRKYLTFLNKESKNYDIAKLAAGFKLLHLLGLNPMHKAEIKFKEEIDFIVKNNIEEIYKNKNVENNLEKIDDILEKEIKNLW